MRSIAFLGAVCVAALSAAQSPDVRIKLDATLSYRTEGAGPTNLRLYSSEGRASTVGIAALFHSGFRAFVSEKLERITNDPDRSLLDEYYFEDPGLWRVGKQVVPFGLGRVIHETVMGARADTNLIFQGLPVSVIACDAGSELQRGAGARIGSRIGLSMFFGHDFGISSASLSQIRFPEDSPGAGRGYQTALGIDGSRRFGKVELKGEFVSLSEGETRRDIDRNIADGTVSYTVAKNTSLLAGYTWVSAPGTQFLRFGASVPITRGFQFEPLIRFKDNALWDLSLQIHVRV